MSGAPEVPTIAESGGPALEGSTWVLILAPVGTPREVVNRLSSEMGRILASAEMRERLEKLGIDAVGSTPAEAARFLDTEIVKWAKVINTAGIKAEQ